MTVTMALLGITIMVLVVYVAMLPVLLERQAARVAQLEYDTAYSAQDLHARYELLVGSIVDLDADYDMGKLSDEVYIEQRKMLLGRSVYLRKQLNQLTEQQASTSDETLEAMIETHRAQRTVQLEDEIEAQIAASRERVTS